MPTEQDVDTERTAVKTYVPSYQKARWRTHAEELGMSQSEFVRTMVQAGRRDFEIPGGDGGPSGGGASEAVSGQSPGVSGRGESLEERILEILASGEHYDWDGLLTELTDDLESRLEDALDGLQQDNRVRYSGRYGGYALVEER